ncbi:OmpA family protein [Chthonobacter albigriseus]|uniref:OmpA family protein n=1 Tax=Chthonobacter albigriseus TaxID=1683161 RepID=UPI0015EF9011|nr:OmpA family protein [Chthonobacter albigriseus]
MVRWQARAAAGILVAVALTFVALLINGGRIVDDVERKSREVLSPEVTSWASVEVDGRDVSLSGSAPTEELRRLAQERVERLFGVRSVDDSSVALLPEAAPYVVTLSRAGSALTISGSAPSGPERRRMVEGFTGAVPNAAYNDRLLLARGAPEKGFGEALARLYPILADISSGSVTLTDQSVAISGEAASNAAYDRLREGVTGLPQGFRVASIDIVRPVATPFSYSAVLDGGAVTVSGYAPDPDTRNALLGAARSAAGQRILRDTVDLASGAPDGFAAAAADALDFLSLMAAGRVDVTDKAISVSGTAATPEAYRTLLAYLDTWNPAGFVVESSIDLPLVKPFTLTVVRDGEKVTVSGFVPSSETLEAVKTAATRVAGLNGAVVEGTLANGAPDGFQAAAVFAVDLMQHLSTGAATIADTRLTIVGAAKTGADLLDVNAEVSANAPEGFEFDVRVSPPLVKPFTWSIEKGAEDVVISGFVPSEESRTVIREAAEDFAGDLGVADRTQLAGGLPAGIDLEAVAAFAADQLAGLDSGKVAFEDGKLSVAGQTKDARAAAAVTRAFDQDLPPGTTKGVVYIDAPPLLQFTIDRGLDALSIQGTIASTKVRDRVADLVARSFGRADVEMSLQEAADLPPGAEEAVIVAIRAAALLATGTVTVSGPTITVQGKAFTGVGATRLSSDIASAVPKGFRLDTSVGVARRGPDVSEGECQALLTDLLSRNAIYFETNKAEIADESHGLIDRIAQTAQRCPEAKLVVEGHTDNVGDPAANLSLSKQRADAVVALLVSTGVDATRLEALGFGADKPAADNSTPDGQARNRRIEMRVVPAAPPAAPAADPAAPAPAPQP